MFSFLASLFGSATIAEKAADGIYNGLDKAIFTDEEKSDANKKVLDWMLEYMKATNPQNVSRRFIAIVVTLLWALLVIVMLAAKALGADAFAEYSFGVMTDIVAVPFGIIIGFYFLAHVVRNSALGERS